MKLLKFLLLSFLLSLAQLSLAEDYVELLNLSNYQEGDTVPTLGENLTVGLIEKTGEKYITVLKDSDGKLSIPINLSGEFEIIMKIEAPHSMEMLIVPSNDESEAKIRLGVSAYSYDYSHINLSDSFERQDVAWNDSDINDYKLLVTGSAVKLYVNGLYREKAKVANPSSTIYTNFLINKIGSNSALHGLFKLYELKVRNLSGTSPVVASGNDYETGKNDGIQQCVANPNSCGITVSTTTSPSASTTDECIANYSSNGELHIPCVNVPGAFGKIEMYDVWMQQQSGAFTFDLDLNRIQAK